MQTSTHNHYTILMLGRNAGPWIDRSLDSALQQEHDNFDVIVVDAASDDGTWETIQRRNVPCIQNTKRKYQSENIFTAVHDMVKKDSIVVTLDFDDWFAHNNVLAVLDKYYNENVWMTYGSYADWYGDDVPRHPQYRNRYDPRDEENNSYRDRSWLASHLRTFRRELFLHIDPVDFIDSKTKDCYTMAGDQSFMLPMLEMCNGKYEAIPEILYIYNKRNPLSDDKTDVQEQIRQANDIRSKPKYGPLESL